MLDVHESQHLVATSPHDGWAIVAQDSSIFLVRPPYGGADIAEVNEEFRAAAVRKYGFELADQVFPNTFGLLTYLREQIQIAQESRHAPSSEDLAKGVIASAHLEELATLLEETQFLLESGDYQASTRALLLILKNPHLRESDELFEQTTDLLDRSTAGVAARAGREGPFAGELYRECYPAATERYGAEQIGVLAGEVRNRNSTLDYG